MIPSELTGRVLAFAAVALAVAVKSAVVDDASHPQRAPMSWVAPAESSAPYGVRLLSMDLEPPAVQVGF